MENTLHLTNYDFFFIAVIGTSTILAMLKGGVAQLLSLSTWFIALFITKNYNEQIEHAIPDLVSNVMLRTLIGYVVVFIGVAIVITIIKIFFHKFIHSFGLNGINITIGAIFGFVRGVIISSILIIFIEMIGMDKTHSWHNSLVSPIIVPTINILVNNMDQMKSIQEEIKKRYDAEAAKQS